MRTALVNAAAGGASGLLSSLAGYPLSTWQFWVVMAINGVLIINNMLGAEQ